MAPELSTMRNQVFFVSKSHSNQSSRVDGMNVAPLSSQSGCRPAPPIAGTPVHRKTVATPERHRVRVAMLAFLLATPLALLPPTDLRAQTPSASPTVKGQNQAVAQTNDADTARKLALADRAGDGDAVLKLATDWIVRDPGAADAHYWRGRERFRRGDVAESVKDFDRYVELRPEREPPQWERGIALYYDRQFARGSKQFELYQTFDNRDVENSVWRYLCLARAESRDKARATLLPVDRDPRVPMTEIFQMFAGKTTPEQVLAAARADDPPAEVLAGRLFYAHLYLALFYESEGQEALCRKYLALAADKELRRNPRINAYMWAVADVHWKMLNATPKDPSNTQSNATPNVSDGKKAATAPDKPVKQP